LFDLTPEERRGAFVLLALAALGTAWDLLHRTPEPAPPAGSVALTARSEPAPSATGAAPGAAAEGGGQASPRGKAARGGSSPVALNSSGAAQLQELPGIGPVLAARIVAYREAHGPFRSADELLGVRGIGPRLLERIRPRIELDAAARTMPASGVQDATRARR